MKTRLHLDIQPQPDDFTCGATCLHAVYDFYGDRLPLKRVIKTVQQSEWGGTYGAILGRHALERGYEATLYTYNLELFDPTWAGLDPDALSERLKKQMAVKRNRRIRSASRAYIDFIAEGGRVGFAGLTPDLIRRQLRKSRPILTGLSATYLYQSEREFDDGYDDVRGTPMGHFVVLCGYDARSHKVRVADPYGADPVSRGQYYEVDIHRLITAILLGVLTYDGNLLVLAPGSG